MYKPPDKNSEYVKTVTDRLLDITFNNSDLKFVQNECLKYIEDDCFDIVCLAISCLGQLARIHNFIDKEKVLKALNEKRKDKQLAGVIEYALNDIEIFVKNSVLKKEKIIKMFVNNFIYKNIKQRSYLQLININKRSDFHKYLYHNCRDIFNEKYLFKLNKEDETKLQIQQTLGFKDNEKCYIISCLSNYDDQIFFFKDIFEKVFHTGEPTIILNFSANTFYLETEEIGAYTERFIGKKL